MSLPHSIVAMPQGKIQPTLLIPVAFSGKTATRNAIVPVRPVPDRLTK
jgi:hypothetical protein